MLFDGKWLNGRKYSDKSVDADKKRLLYEIIDKEGKPFIGVEVKGEKRQVVSEKVLAMALTNVDKVVMVLAYINNANRQATKGTGTIASLARITCWPSTSAAVLSMGSRLPLMMG
ncbi:hypothetical protein DVH05_010277 [Phytophthora capsici]|nr:hypothetical protein DVH05_010277 [Phytophthora capsici]